MERIAGFGLFNTGDEEVKFLIGYSDSQAVAFKSGQESGTQAVGRHIDLLIQIRPCNLSYLYGLKQRHFCTS